MKDSLLWGNLYISGTVADPVGPDGLAILDRQSGFNVTGETKADRNLARRT